MTQRLRNKVKDEQGNERIVISEVIRSWQDGSGAQVYLHTNGTHGYKDGSPVKRDLELSIIPDGPQRKIAQSWWDRVGKEKSEAFYSAQADKLKLLAGDFAPGAEGSDSEKDIVLYYKLPSGQDGKENIEKKAYSWMELFPRRPDWWGSAGTISFDDFVYEMVEEELLTVDGSQLTVDEEAKGKDVKGKPSKPDTKKKTSEKESVNY